MIQKRTVKQILGELPLTAEAYWYLRQPGQPLNKTFSLEELRQGLPDWRQQAMAGTATAPGKNVLIFAVLHYWISHAALMGLALSGGGNRVTLAYLPYGKWQKPINRFDLRRQNIYTRSVLRLAEPALETLSLLDLNGKSKRLPKSLQESVEEISLRDTQYTLQVEGVSLESDLYRLRLARNSQAAIAALTQMESSCPDVVVIPNGSILEFGVVYQVARHLEIPVVTYEFGEQRGRIWIAQDSEVMRQDTRALWQARSGRELSSEQLGQVRTLFETRQRASVWENFARRWQGVPRTGGEQTRSNLGLDARLIVLLATNVIGDSLTLGRQVFSDSMTEWLMRTVLYFAVHTDVQFVVRIHPGELITKGPSVADVVHQTIPDLPENIHIVPADAPVNTYDLIEIADLGLVYTTTVGLEMAMSGLPVIVVGRTHYRDKGFTLDPDSWDTYFQFLSQVLANPGKFRPAKAQVECAWEYAYRFFFEYPHPFPWHLVHLWKDIDEWPVGRVLSEEGQTAFGGAFRYLVGEPVDWSKAS